MTTNDNEAIVASNEENWWWLAINGATCAASFLPLPETVVVSPTPQQLVGFKTREAQKAAQKKLLTAPMPEVCRYMREVLPAKRDRGEIKVIRPKKPQRPTDGPTMWMAGRDESAAEVAQDVADALDQLRSPAFSPEND